MTTPTPVVAITRSFAYISATDNHEPPRQQIVGGAEVFTNDDEGIETIVLLLAFEKFLDPHKAVFLIDEGTSVEPWYVSGWQQTPDSQYEGSVFLRRFPLSVGTRADNGQPVDMSHWMLGPRKCYHLKVKT